MSLDDLRRELRSRAADPGSTPMSDRLAGVQSKVVAARRRKAVASGAAALASLSIIAVTWTQVVDGSGGGDVADAKLEPLPEQVNGDLLVAYRYNEADSSELSWDLRLDGLAVVPRTTCVLPSGADLPDPDAPVQLEWRVNGNAPVGTTCGESGDARMSSVLGPHTRTAWRALGVRRHQQFEVEVWLTQGGVPIEVPGARFGIGFYDKTGERIPSDGVRIPELTQVDGETYELAGYETLPLSEGPRRIQLRTQVSDGPLAVLYGWQVDIPAAEYELTQDGDFLDGGHGGQLEGSRLIDGATEHQLALQAYGSSAEGVLVLAYYELID